MGIKTESYRRKPLEVEAVQVTSENLYEVAEWCGGAVHTIKTGEETKVFINVPVINSNRNPQFRASIGSWVLSSESGFKVYSERSFNNAFVKGE